MRRELISFDRLTGMRLEEEEARGSLKERIQLLGLRKIIQRRNSSVLKFISLWEHRLQEEVATFVIF